MNVPSINCNIGLSVHAASSFKTGSVKEEKRKLKLFDDGSMDHGSLAALSRDQIESIEFLLH